MAIIVAVLYFGMIELMMIDASRELAEARRFRARIVALTLAENAAEGAAVRIIDEMPKAFNDANDQGVMSGKATKGSGGTFVLTGEGESSGLESTRAKVHVQGVVAGKHINIDLTLHSQ